MNYLNIRTMHDKQLTSKKGKKRVERWGRLQKFASKDESGIQSIIGLTPLLPLEIIMSADNVISHGR